MRFPFPTAQSAIIYFSFTLCCFRESVDIPRARTPKYSIHFSRCKKKREKSNSLGARGVKLTGVSQREGEREIEGLRASPDEEFIETVLTFWEVNKLPSSEHSCLTFDRAKPLMHIIIWRKGLALHNVSGNVSGRFHSWPEVGKKIKIWSDRWSC